MHSNEMRALFDAAFRGDSSVGAPQFAALAVAVL
jgi:hypothetical protein